MEGDDLKPMDADQLREHAHKMVDFIADYYKNIEQFPVLSQVQPGYLRELLPDSAPSRPESLQDVLDDVQTKILPGVTHWQSPDYFAYFPSNSSVAGFLGEMLSAGISNGLWFHVDAAYAGSACICPEFRHFIDGVELANSFNMNAHKWFLTNFDCSALWVKERSALVQSLSTNPEYLKNKASQGNTVVDYKDWQIPLGRRFRSLKLWMVFRLYGLENLRTYIRSHIELANKFEQLVKLDPRFEVVAPRNFSLVCFRLLSTQKDLECSNRLNRELLDAVNSTGKLFISHTVLSEKYVLRLAVGAPLTEERHVVSAWETLQENASALLVRN
ncbi:PREDICTED: tyrosine decarboxylase 1 [Erythranthe guttata]|nr:PREDICTED: tyrosine decarboxylase 1 [Erythranthe guttata]|eukprot:XP_012835795.1 PREDICTED: tyrosine decarboxylase 1 [Erythranthe guttata]